MSQTPIREALTRLESEGLVAKHHLRGYRATDELGTADLEKMFDMRAVIEPAAARWAAANIDTATFEELDELLATMEERAKSGSYGDFAIQDARFHALIARASDNDLLQKSLARLHIHLHLFRVRRDAEVADSAINEHRLILEAIRQRDPILADAAMASHISRSWARLQAVL